jgi:dihydrofolate synthase/folylpolyglutamate synthase
MASGPEAAEGWLDSLAGIGWRPGLERIDALCSLLGNPQGRFRSIHVVGTNGKTSTVRAAGAILTARGIRNGCMTSPHFERWSERVMVDGQPVDEDLWAKAVARVREAVPEVESSVPDHGAVTQFEASVAAELLTLAESGVEVAVVEAGMGGRLDATNVLSAEVVVLTSVGLDHTEWLGPTVLDIAAEKLAVLDIGSTLITGPLDAEVDELARRTADDLGCRVLSVSEGSRKWPRGAFRRLAFELAGTAVEATVGRTDEEVLDRISREISVPGRLEALGGRPETYFDVAHNPDGIRALVAAVPEIAEGRPVVTVFGVLADKDHRSMLEAMRDLQSEQGLLLLCLPGSDTGDASGRKAVDPVELAEAAAELGMAATVVADPAEAVEVARREAGRRGAIVLVCGSHRLRSALQG